MSNSSSKNVIEKIFDEFKNLTVIQHTRWVGFGGGFSGLDGDRNTRFRLRKIIAKEIDTLILDFDTTSYDWLFPNKVTLLIDDQTDELPFLELSSEVIRDYRSNGRVGCRESGLIVMSQSLLKTICDCNSIKMRVYCRNGYYPIPDDWCPTFRVYCQQFYHAVFDSTLYSESLAFTPSSGQGCFIATAAMGSYDDPRVKSLRQFRDTCLLKFSLGIYFVFFYYSISPPIAALLRHSSILRCIFRHLLVIPLSKIAVFLLHEKHKN